jgi:hypothetical protein
MISRAIVAAFYGIIGLASVVAWATIDSRLCDTYEQLCKTPPEFCGGIDSCPPNAHAVFDFIIYAIAPPILFGATGYLKHKRKNGILAAKRTVLICIAIHWSLTFIGTRIFRF